MPQGSVLGPFLFLINVNDIEEGLTCKILNFDDVTVITSKVTTLAEKLQLLSNFDILVSCYEK